MSTYLLAVGERLAIDLGQHPHVGPREPAEDRPGADPQRLPPLGAEGALVDQGDVGQAGLLDVGGQIRDHPAVGFDQDHLGVRDLFRKPHRIETPVGTQFDHH